MSITECVIYPITGSRRHYARARVVDVGLVSQVRFIGGWPLRVGIAIFKPNFLHRTVGNFAAKKSFPQLQKFYFICFQSFKQK